MLDAAIRCFYSFQESCTVNHSLTRQKRCSRDLNFETETGLKLRDRDFIKKPPDSRLENLQIMPKCLKNLKKGSSPLRNWNFSIFRRFPTCLCYFSPVDATDKKHVELNKFY